MEKYEITIISDSDCKDCKRMYDLILSILKELKLDKVVSIIKVDSESENAIDIALDKKIFDLPGCCIGGTSIYGKDFKDIDVRKAIESLLL